jgi:hypothetical protein
MRWGRFVEDFKDSRKALGERSSVGYDIFIG